MAWRCALVAHVLLREKVEAFPNLLVSNLLETWDPQIINQFRTQECMSPLRKGPLYLERRLFALGERKLTLVKRAIIKP